MIVDIKGVGQARFPDEMPIDDIRSFLRNKYYQRAAQGQSDILAPAPQTVSPYEPTLTERLGGGIAEGLKGAGLISDNYGAQQIGKNVTALGEFLPGIGDAAAGDDFGRAVAEGDNFGMAMAGLGVIPVAGDVAKQALRRVKSVDLPSGKLGSDQFKIIKQSDPKAKTKTNPDGTVNVTYLEEYQPKQLKGPLHEFDPDALELSEGAFKNTDTYKGDKDSPITVTKQGGDYVILDGHHRAKLAKQDGRNVKAVVLPIEDVAEMKKDNIHQADMRKEWIARGNYKLEEASKALKGLDDFDLFSDKVAARREARLSVFDLPTKGKPENIKHITDLTNYTPEQLVSQLKVLDQSNIKQGGYLKKGDGLDVFYKNDGTSQMIDPKTNEVIFEQSREQTENLAKNDILEISEGKLSPEQRKLEFDARKKQQAEARAREEAQQETYKMQHTAPMREGNSVGHDLTSSFGGDIYTGNAVRYFGGGTKDSLAMDTKAVNIIQGMRGNPEKSVTIYRAVPKDVKSINASDWVTTTKEYAQDHMEGEKGWHILSKKVKAKDIATDGNSIHEFGYDPDN